MTEPTYSATQLSGFLACPHLSLLTRAVREGHRAAAPKFPDPALEALFRRGLEHEAAFEAALRAEGLEVLRIEEPPRDLGTDEYWRRYTEATATAMRTGVQVIVQGGRRDGVWVGRPDFLRRADLPGGGWTYEVIDTKLAREAKGGAVLQVLLYAHLVEAVHGAAPEHVYLALGGPEPRTEGFRVADYAAYFRAVRGRFLRFQSGYPGPPLPPAPDPVEHCVVCAWRSVCAGERRTADHLSLVAGIRRAQSQSLRQGGLPSLTALGDLPRGQGVEGVSRAGMERIREQARIQLEGRRARRHLHELLPLEEGRGLAALPEPSPGDLFLDFESNAFAFTHGIEYLFGVVDADGRYVARWAPTKGEEKAAFEEFIDLMVRRWELWPGLHVYHFADHEESALKRMAGFHATREAELDHLLRGHVLVDLLRVVKQALRASVESNSIKKLEPLYGYVREEDLRDASAALARLDALLESGEIGDQASEVRRAVERYNRDDCLSTPRPPGVAGIAASRAGARRDPGLPAGARPGGRGGRGAADRGAAPHGRPPRPRARGPGGGPPGAGPHWLLAQLLEFLCFEGPGVPIPPEVARLTRIGDVDVRGGRLDEEALAGLAAAARIVIAHNAAFDRRFGERRLPAFRSRPWACSMAEVPWSEEGLGSAGLESLLYRHCGRFAEAHRADADCLATLALLATPLPSGRSPLLLLLESARRPTKECAWLSATVYGGAGRGWEAERFGAERRYAEGF